MNVHAIRRSLPSVWEPGRGVKVHEMEGGLTCSDLSINWIFVRSSTRDHGTSTVCYSNSSR
ncbi:hypothetical protein LINGRAPRIM_LOCUS2297 [Linum grandiflorum]